MTDDAKSKDKIKELESQLKEQKEQTEFYRNIVNNMSDAVCISDKSLKIIDLNPANEKLTGFTREEVLGKKITDLNMMPKDELEKIMKLMPDLLKGKSIENMEMNLLSKDGKKIPTLSSTGILKDSKGKMTGMVTTMRDITDMKKLMQEQEEANNFSKSIIDNMSDMVCIADPKMKIIDCNSATEKITGYKTSEVIGKGIQELDMLDKESMGKMMKETMPKLLKGEPVDNQETIINTKDGRKIPTLTSTGIIRDSKGKMTGMVTTIRDIADIKNLMQEQEEAAAYLNKNVKNMLAVTTAAAKGDLSKRVEKERDDEVGALAEGLNNMVGNIDKMLKAQEEERLYLEEVTSQLGVVLQAAADGDLSLRVEKTRDDQIGSVIDACNQTMERLSQIISNNIEMAKRVLDSANNLAGTSEEMNAGMEQLASESSQVAEGAAKLAEIVQWTAKNIDGASKILEDTDKSVTKSSDEGKNAINVSKEVQKAAKDAGVSFEKIQTSITETSESVGTMSNSIDRVSEMGNVITDVASQTNMLALNAAIEAARAGEAGKGFAVVADAVKDLAEQVKNAARESINAVDEIKASGTHAISVSSEADHEAEEGGTVLTKALKGVDNTVESLEGINHMLQNVNEGTKKVVETFKDVIASIDKISAISETNASSAEESSASVEEQTASIEELTAESQNLSDLAQNMMDELKIFVLAAEEDPVEGDTETE